MTFRSLNSSASESDAPVSRRDFLTLRTSGTNRVLELACEPLFMRYVDACSSVGARGGEDASAAVRFAVFGEPQTDIDLPTAQALFAKLEEKLRDADVLRVMGREWLSDADFGRRVSACIDAFASRGGRVEYGESVPGPAGASRA
jgi:hypothetical protein